jgi:hypothetical protein
MMSDLNSEQAKLQFQFTTVLDLGKFMYDSYFKLATMSFTLNGLLLTAVSFLSNQAGAEKLNGINIPLVGFIGFIYNLGALATYGSLVSLAGSLSRRFASVDGELAMGINQCRSSLSNWLGSITLLLTFLFFILWICVWFWIGDVWATISKFF